MAKTRIRRWIASSPESSESLLAGVSAQRAAQVVGLVGAEAANPPVPNQALLSAARQVPASLVLLSFKSPVMKNGRFDLPNRGSPDRLSDMSQFAEKEALDYRSIASV